MENECLPTVRAEGGDGGGERAIVVATDAVHRRLLQIFVNKT